MYFFCRAPSFSVVPCFESSSFTHPVSLHPGEVSGYVIRYTTRIADLLVLELIAPREKEKYIITPTHQCLYYFYFCFTFSSCVFHAILFCSPISSNKDSTSMWPSSGSASYLWPCPAATGHNELNTRYRGYWTVAR